MTGEGTNNWFGYSVSGAGDVNNDGYDDVIVGAFSYLVNGKAYIYSDPSAPLPVEMIAFTAIAKNRDIQLHWMTATEVHNYGFEVERRRVDGPTTQWLKVAFLKGSGSSNSPKEYSFTDTKLSSGRYAYRLKQIDMGGTFKYSESVEVEVGGVPRLFTLNQNYPNPFNPRTTIEFTLAEDNKVTLRIIDILGREVITLVNDEMKAGVLHQIPFDASQLSSGVYFSLLESGGKKLVKKLMLMK